MHADLSTNTQDLLIGPSSYSLSTLKLWSDVTLVNVFPQSMASLDLWPLSMHVSSSKSMCPQSALCGLT